MGSSIQSRRCRSFLLVLALLASVGCGSSVKLVPAQGVVKINGQPAADISVQFLPDEMKGSRGPTSAGVTDNEGKFVLKTFDGREGAVPGPHKVLLVDLREERAPQGRASKPPRVDSRYSIAGPDSLASEVKEGDAAPIVIDVPGRVR
jgi:hypothetical protein